MSSALSDKAAHASVSHSAMANAIRALAMDAVEAAQSGHPGLPMGMADVATVLFTRFLKYDAGHPTWPDRDRFVLSGGHGSMLLYSLGYLTGYDRMTLAELRRFRQLESLTPGHPEHDPEAGIETTTGPLGQGIANAVGMALAERILNARFGDGLVDHRTFVIASDGDLMEGISHEACSLAGHLRLDRLIVLYDDNGISIDGPTSLSFSDDSVARFAAYGWATARIDGHDPAAIEAAIAAALESDRPSLIACRTQIGCGAPNKQGTAACHGSPLGAEEVAAARLHLDWPHQPFEVPDEILAAWRRAGGRGASERRAWEQRLAGASDRPAFEAALDGALPDAARQKLAELKQKLATERPKIATRQASGQVLDVLVPAWSGLIGGSADLTPSNNTKTKTGDDIKPGQYGGRYVRYGVREHAMAAAMNGMALHRGLVPYGGTFLTFSDYCRPSIRLAALMRQRVVFVMTHDSIGLGEDGPTHQPVEHLAALRAIPNLLVLRPADAVETAECWEIALDHRGGPSLLALTRQALPPFREPGADNLSARGGYIAKEAGQQHVVTLLATGSELSIAAEARGILEAEGIGARLVSLPSLELFGAQDEAYRRSVLGAAPIRIAVEAGVGQGWDRLIGEHGAFVGMTGFGASAPYAELYRHFGITGKAIADTARAKVINYSQA